MRKALVLVLLIGLLGAVSLGCSDKPPGAGDSSKANAPSFEPKGNKKK
jgi:hypothetical protein